MHILAVDGERAALSALEGELRKIFPHGHLRCEGSVPPALEWAAQLHESGKRLDYAFLETCQPGMDGLELARRLKTLHPKLILIFCTAYTEYAYEAVKLYARGYLTKPVSAAQVERTLDEMVPGWQEGPRGGKIRIQTFGHFEVFVNGRPLSFEREKAKELLAYLVDRHGEPATTEQIAGVLWEGRPYGRDLKNYVGTVLSSLRRTLRAAGAEEILVKSRNRLAIDPEKVSCDAYDYERGDDLAVGFFHGEYMANYSWAEFTAGRYTYMK